MKVGSKLIEMDIQKCLQLEEQEIYKWWNEREHITILSAILADGGTIPNMYVFKGARARKRYIGLNEEGAIIGMQKRVDGQPSFFTMDGAFFAIIDKKGRFLTFPKAFDGS